MTSPTPLDLLAAAGRLAARHAERCREQTVLLVAASRQRCALSRRAVTDARPVRRLPVPAQGGLGGTAAASRSR